MKEQDRLRNMAECKKVLEEIDREHSEEEIAEAAALLSVRPNDRQPSLPLSVAA